jgi:hypothetical protein
VDTYSDIKNRSVLGVSIVPQTIASATTTNGSSVDCQPADGPISALLMTGDNGDATLALAVKLQEAIEDPANAGTALSSDWSDMAGAAFATLSGATAGDNQDLAITNLRTKRFVRAVAVTTGGGTLSCKIAVGILGRKKMTGSGNGAYFS